jgi:hypothetical protein
MPDETAMSTAIVGISSTRARQETAVVRRGTVQSIEGATCTIALAGGTVTSVPILSRADLVVGKTTVLLQQGNSLVALGATGGSAGGGGGKYSKVITGGSITEVVTHGLGTRAIVANVFRNSAPWDLVLCDIAATTVDTVTLTFYSVPAAGQFVVNVVG